MSTLKNIITEKPLAKRRDITVGFRVENNIMYVQSGLKDNHHDMELFLKINIKTKNIEDIEAYTYNVPFPDCSGVKDVLLKIKSLAIIPGVKKAYHDTIKREEGCVHFTEIFIATVDFVFAGLYGPENTARTEEEKNRIRKRNADILLANNSCRIFNLKNKAHFDENGRFKQKDYHY